MTNFLSVALKVTRQTSPPLTHHPAGTDTKGAVRMRNNKSSEAARQKKLQGLADKICALQITEAQSVIDSGLLLKEARSQLGHGEWIPWLENNFGWDRTTAHRRMRIAERFKCCNVQHIAPTLLSLLASPPIPLQQPIPAPAPNIS